MAEMLTSPLNASCGAWGQCSFMTNRSQACCAGNWLSPHSVWVVSYENLVNYSDGLTGFLPASGSAATVIVVRTIKQMPQDPFRTFLTGSVQDCHATFMASIFSGQPAPYQICVSVSVQDQVDQRTSAVLAPLLALLVPISDTAFAIIRRKLSGQSVSHADHDHLHHRLLELGLGQKNAVLSIYLVTILGGALGLVSGFTPIETAGYCRSDGYRCIRGREQGRTADNIPQEREESG